MSADLHSAGAGERGPSGVGAGERGRGSGAAARARLLGQWLLPAGPLDLVVQFVVVAVAYTGWRYARGAVDGSASASLAHAVDLIDLERWLRTFYERDLQDWAVDSGWAIDFANWMYSNAHFTGSWLALGFVYFFRRDSFGFVRNMLIAAMAISFVCYWLYPTAPPRFVSGLGIEDTIAQASGKPPVTASDDAFFNPFAAVPSMHVGLATLFGWSLALLVRPRPLKAILFAYPLLVTYVVVATGNHYWIDGLFGFFAAAAAAGVAVLLSKLRPRWWSFHPRRAIGGRDLAPWRRPRGETESGEHAA